MKNKLILLSAAVFALTFSSCRSSKEISKESVNVNKIREIQHIRNATVIIAFNNLKLLVDPILSDKATEAPMPFSNTNKNPLIELPMDKSEVLNGVNAVLLTHYHTDHFDLGAETFLPKDMLIFCQPYDLAKLREKGFLNLQPIDSSFNWKGIEISRFATNHHEGATGELPFGESSSFHLQTKNESLFITGDAILDHSLLSVLTAIKPKVILANTGECQFTEDNPVLEANITMTLTKEELKRITILLPRTKLIAIHMDAINHCSLSKEELNEYIQDQNLNENIMIPNEGDVITFKRIVM